MENLVSTRHTLSRPSRSIDMELTAYIFRPNKPFGVWELMIDTPDGFVDGEFPTKAAAMAHATRWASQRNLTVTFKTQPPLPVF